MAFLSGQNSIQTREVSESCVIYELQYLLLILRQYDFKDFETFKLDYKVISTEHFITILEEFPKIQPKMRSYIIP